MTLPGHLGVQTSCGFQPPSCCCFRYSHQHLSRTGMAVTSMFSVAEHHTFCMHTRLSPAACPAEAATHAGVCLLFASLCIQRRLAQQLAARGVPLDAPLRDQRPLMCNVDDYLRMCAVPKEKGANFRDMPGVITHNDSEC